MRPLHVVGVVLLLAAAAEAHHGDTLLTYVEANGHFRAGLLAAGVGAPDDGEPVPPAGVGPVNLARFPFVAHACHPRLQVLLDFAPRNATVAAPGAFAEVPFEFRVEFLDDATGERLPEATLRFTAPGSRMYGLDPAFAGAALRADLYMLRGAAADWDLAVRGWPDPFVACTLAPVVNEVEADPAGPDAGAEWVELYNPNVVARDVSGWTLRTTSASVALPAGTTLAAQGRLVVVFPTEALAEADEIVRLEDASGAEQDRTPVLTDGEDDARTHQRSPDGAWATWAFLPGTPDAANAEP